MVQMYIINQAYPPSRTSELITDDMEEYMKHQYQCHLINIQEKKDEHMRSIIHLR